ncbi:MAG TPA: alpha-galactosidase [Microlunatus sp.]|nr:alpha-galactosidase [Microlunatus sp.]
METVRLTYEGIEAQLAVGGDRPPCLIGIVTDAGEAAFDGPAVPLVEVMSPAYGHDLPTQRLSGTVLGARLRYTGHTRCPHGWEVELADPVGALAVTLRLTSRAANTLGAVVTVRNTGRDCLVLSAVPSLNLPISARTAGSATHRTDLHVWHARGDWMGESRWRREPIADLLPDLHLPRGAAAKRAERWVSTGSWSTADALPVGVVESEAIGWALGWQVEHNGAWRTEIADLGSGLQLTLSGPTDADHGWCEVLAPGEQFVSVPVTVAAGADRNGVIRALTAHRRTARRPHRDNTVPTLIYNDYMNTLMGDPTTATLLPLIRQAAGVGAEVFCIDAGWYDDSSGWWDAVGAWRPSTTRFPGGFDEVIQAIRDAGMVPGLWLEPEVVGVRSPMADALPADAFFHRGGVRIREAGRYHLDLRHPAARAHLDEVVDRLVGEHGIGFFKLDYNINPGPGTDRDAHSVGAGLLGHNRAHLAWLDGVLDRHPDLVIENCGSGAMRMDFALLSRLQLQSTTDQEDPAAYAPISVAAPMTILPEQAGSWAYPSIEMDDEQTAYVLSLGLLGRLYLSGFLDRLRPSQQELVGGAVAAYRAIRGTIPQRFPVWPTGLPGWDAPWLSLGLVGDQDTLLTIFRRGDASPRVGLDLPAYAGREVAVEPVFPTALAPWGTAWDPEGGTLRVLGEGAGLAARTYRVTPTS